MAWYFSISPHAIKRDMRAILDWTGMDGAHPAAMKILRPSEMLAEVFEV